MTPTVPDSSQALADTLTADSGDGVANITHVEDRRRPIAAANARVHVWVEYEVLRHGRLKWRDSELFVDGGEVALADDNNHLIAIFHDPDRVLPGGRNAAWV